MKYIRTKDNRLFRVIKDLTYENTYYFETKAEMLTIMTEEKYLSTMGKVADTIEELCDEFVWANYGSGYLYKSFSRVKYAYYHEPLSMDGKGDIYGAIWTGKGLIYVAKMNEKGELELL